MRGMGRANTRGKGRGAKGRLRGDTYSSGSDSEREDEDTNQEDTDSESHRIPRRRNHSRHASKRQKHLVILSSIFVHTSLNEALASLLVREPFLNACS